MTSRIKQIFDSFLLVKQYFLIADQFYKQIYVILLYYNLDDRNKSYSSV
jgi:hypothetical protein